MMEAEVVAAERIAEGYWGLQTGYKP